MSGNSDQLHAAADALRGGDRDAARKAIQPALIYPTGLEFNEPEWAQALGILAIVGSGSMSDEMMAALNAARAAPGDVQAVYNLGYQMIEFGLPRVAATALARANALSPDIPALVNELSSALESSGLYLEAYETLRLAYDARQKDWTSRYLLAFNALMSGNVSATRQAFTEMGDPPDETSQVMSDRIAMFLDRVKKMANISSLDDQDLLGWHQVITGGILTHLSPHGFDEGMNGRYAFVQDSHALVHESVVRAIVVLKAWQLRPEQLIYSNDRSSEIFAHVWQQRTHIPIKAFEPGDEKLSALFVSYDLSEAGSPFLDAVHTRRPGQVLLSHAHCWTKDSPFLGDMTTLLYQHNTAPWAGQLIQNPETGQTEPGPADDSPAADIAAQVVAAEIPAAALAGLEVLGAFATACGLQPPGRRDRFFVGGPVASSRF